MAYAFCGSASASKYCATTSERFSAPPSSLLRFTEPVEGSYTYSVVPCGVAITVATCTCSFSVELFAVADACLNAAVSTLVSFVGMLILSPA